MPNEPSNGSPTGHGPQNLSPYTGNQQNTPGGPQQNSFTPYTNRNQEDLRNRYLDSLTASDEDSKAFEQHLKQIEAYRKKLDEANAELKKADTPENQKKFEDALDVFIKANKTFKRAVDLSTEGLKSSVDSLEKSTGELLKNPVDFNKAVHDQLDRISSVLGKFNRDADKLIRKISTGTLTNSDIASFYKILNQQAKIQGMVPTQLQALKAQIGNFVRDAEKAFKSGNSAEADALSKKTLDAINKSLNRQSEAAANALVTRVSRFEKELERLDREGKGDSLKARLLRNGFRQTAGEEVQSVRKNETFRDLTGGASSNFGGKYITSDGKLDQGAIQAQLLTNLKNIGSNGWQAYRRYGSEFGAADRGFSDHLKGAVSYTSLQSDMAMTGYKYGRTTEEALQTFDQVAKSLRVGNSDIGKRKQILEEMTRTTIKLSTATGLQEGKLVELAAVYRNNLGQGASQASKAGLEVVKSLDLINKGLSEDVRGSSEQIQEIFMDLGRESSAFGSDIKEINFWAGKAANEFGKFGIGLAKSKEMVEAIAKLQTGQQTVGSGISAEFAMLQDRYMKINQSRAATLVGGQGNLNHLRSIRNEYEFADTAAAQIEKAGNKAFADSLRKKSMENPLVAQAFQAMMTNDKTKLLALNQDKAGQDAIAQVRGIEGFKEATGFDNKDVNRDLFRKTESTGQGSVFQSALGMDPKQKQLLYLANKIDSGKATEQELKDYKSAQADQKAEDKATKSADSAGNARKVADPMGALGNILDALKTNLILNTIALGVNTAAILGKSLLDWRSGRGLPGGAGSKVGAALEAENAAKVAAEAGSTAIKAERVAEGAGKVASAAKLAASEAAAKSPLVGRLSAAGEGVSGVRKTVAVESKVASTLKNLKEVDHAKGAREALSKIRARNLARPEILRTRASAEEAGKLALEAANHAKDLRATASAAEESAQLAKAAAEIANKPGMFGRAAASIGRVLGGSRAVSKGSKLLGRGSALLSKIPGAGLIKGAGSIAEKAAIPLMAVEALGGQTWDAWNNSDEYAKRGILGQLGHDFEGSKNSYLNSWENAKKGNVFRALGHGAWGALQTVGEIPGAVSGLGAQVGNKLGVGTGLGWVLDHSTRSDNKSIDNQITADNMIRALQSKSGKTKDYDFSNLSKEDREKYAKDLQTRNKDLKDSEKSTLFSWKGLLTGHTDKLFQRELQYAMRDVESKQRGAAPAPSMWNKLTGAILHPFSGPQMAPAFQGAAAGAGVGAPPGSRANPLNAGMEFNSGTNEIVFKVTDASKVMGHSFLDLFRNNSRS